MAGYYRTPPPLSREELRSVAAKEYELRPAALDARIHDVDLIGKAVLKQRQGDTSARELRGHSPSEGDSQPIAFGCHSGRPQGDPPASPVGHHERVVEHRVEECRVDPSGKIVSIHMHDGADESSLGCLEFHAGGVDRVRAPSGKYQHECDWRDGAILHHHGTRCAAITNATLAVATEVNRARQCSAWIASPAGARSKRSARVRVAIIVVNTRA